MWLLFDLEREKTENLARLSRAINNVAIRCMGTFAIFFSSKTEVAHHGYIFTFRTCCCEIPVNKQDSRNKRNW